MEGGGGAPLGAGRPEHRPEHGRHRHLRRQPEAPRRGSVGRASGLVARAMPSPRASFIVGRRASSARCSSSWPFVSCPSCVARPPSSSPPSSSVFSFVAPVVRRRHRSLWSTSLVARSACHAVARLHTHSKRVYTRTSRALHSQRAPAVFPGRLGACNDITRICARAVSARARTGGVVDRRPWPIGGPSCRLLSAIHPPEWFGPMSSSPSSPAGCLLPPSTICFPVVASVIARCLCSLVRRPSVVQCRLKTSNVV